MEHLNIYDKLRRKKNYNYDSNNKGRNKISRLAIQKYSPRKKSKIGKVVSQNL
jgi:ribosomal protein L33